MNPYLLTCYSSPFPKMRIGREYDGGYIIVDIPNANYSTLIACGISNDISFEVDFLSRFPNANCFAYDGTIEKLPEENDKITFIRKNISPVNDDNNTNLHDIIDANTQLFLKMDIEGAEIPWIKSLSDGQLSKFEQITIEFHSPFSNAEIDVFNRINNYYYLVHFHANNCCGVRNHRGVNIPNVFECTFLNKRHFNGAVPSFNTDAIPGDLDMPNESFKPDIEIDYPPFVYGHP